MKTTLYKKYCVWLIISIAISFSIGMALNVLIDPKLENDLVQFQNINKVKIINDTPTAVSFYNKLKVEKRSLIFGTSRSQLYSSEIMGEPVLNLHPVYGNPYGVLDFLNQLDERQWANINKVFYLLDVHTFKGSQDSKPFDYKNGSTLLSRIVRTTDLGNSWNSLRTLTFNYFTKSGTKPNQGIHTHFYLVSDDGSRRIFNRDVRFDTRGFKWLLIDSQEYTDDAIAKLGEIHRLLSSRKIPVVYFTGTFPNDSNRMFNMYTMQRQWEGILEQIPSFLNVLSVESISNIVQDGFLTYFCDNAHLNQEGTKLVYDNIIKVNHPHYIVTKQNIKEQLQKLHARMSLQQTSSTTEKKENWRVVGG